MGGEEISCAGSGQRRLERQPISHHEAAGSLQHSESRVPLVEMANLWLESECGEQAPTSDAEHELLHEAQIGAASIELARDAAIGGIVSHVVTVEQVEPHPPDLHLPGAQPDGMAGQIEF